MTKHPDLFAALAAPFAASEVKTRVQSGRELSYITARTAMNRLDAVLGPENWTDDYQPFGSEGVKCVLTIRLPDGELVTKAGIGGTTKMHDPSDTDKTGESDALKRAAVKFGVARYLYRDGIPDYGGSADEKAPSEPGQSQTPPLAAAGRPRRGADRRPETWSWWIGPRLRQVNAEWMREMVREGIEPGVRSEWKELGNESHEVNAICSALVKAGRLDAAAIAKDRNPSVRDPRKARAHVMEMFERSPDVVKRFVERHLRRKRSEARATLGMPDLEGDDAEGSAEATAEPSNETAGAA